MTATTSRPAPPPPVSGNGRAPAGVRVGVGTTRRVPWIMLGLLLTAGASLAFLAALGSRGERVSVVAAAHDLQPGQPVALGDLRTVTINADVDVPVVSADQASTLVGRVPVAPLSSGTLITSTMLAEGTTVAEGETVVGANLAPGEIPGPDLLAGDRVALVEVASTNAAESSSPTVLSMGSVYSIDELSDKGDVLVALRVPLDSGAAVANAAGQKRLRLLLVPPGATLEQMRASLGSTSTETTDTSRPG